jgi:2-oxoglutarate dehydrogenase E2 component (dihydrolipoamide succinyltransferase)
MTEKEKHQMEKEVKVPSVGESISTGTIVSWIKHDGDTVKEGENLFELETDKAVLDIPSPGSGTLEILVEEGEEVKIGQTVASLSSEEKSKSTEEVPKPVKEIKKEKTEEKKEKAEPQIAQPTEKAEPIVQQNVPTQPEEAEKKPHAEERRSKRVPMSAIRKRTAERLVKAMQNSAYITTFNEIDMQKVIDIRQQYKEQFEKEHGIKIGFMSFFVKACVQTLKEFPSANTQVDGSDIIYNYFYDIGIAVSIEEGLIVPVIRDADKLHFAEVEKKIADFAKRAGEKKILPDELAGGTFTITNGGIFGSLFSTPIPAFPQTAILGMHAIKNRPAVIDDRITIRPVMFAALSYDHRVIDGRDAVRFLARIKEYIEEPDKLLLEL